MPIDQRPGDGRADDSPLAAIPSPEEIRKRMTRNADENRILRSLYRLARRVESYEQEAAEAGQRTAHY